VVKTDSGEDALVRDLAPLSELEVSPAKSDQTRARCQALLARRRRGDAVTRLAAGLLERLWPLLGPAIVSAMVVLYLGGAIEKALRILVR